MELENALSKYKPIIGIEIHAQLKTNSKAYCGDKNEFGASPNTLTSPISFTEKISIYPGSHKKLLRSVVQIQHLSCGFKFTEI